jgi:Tol biopolymer transport system component
VTPTGTHVRRTALTAIQTAALALTLATVALLSLSSAAINPSPASGSQIAFISDRDGNWEIYVMNPDGSGQTRLTNSPDEDRLPSWSPDGRYIAFASNRQGDWGIYVLDVEAARRGGGIAEATRLTKWPGNDRDPAWSPDGTRLAFSSPRDDDWEIYLIAVDGRGETQLTNNRAADWLPAWSPDGKRIAFVSDRDGNWEIYTMNAAPPAGGTGGSEQTNRTNNAADDWVPAWSPDGTHIAFQSNRDGNWEIYTMNTDGTEQTNLTNDPSDDWDPAWSPDGRRIVFMSERDGNREIYTMNAEDGSQVIRLTHNPAADKSPVWSLRR